MVQLQTKRPTMREITDYQSGGWASLNPFSLSLPLPFWTSHTSHLLFCRPAICPHSSDPRCKDQAQDRSEPGTRKIYICQDSCKLSPAGASQKEAAEQVREQKEWLENISYIKTSWVHHLKCNCKCWRQHAKHLVNIAYHHIITQTMRGETRGSEVDVCGLLLDVWNLWSGQIP